MDNVVLVCVVSKKENRGRGIWTYHDNRTTEIKKTAYARIAARSYSLSFTKNINGQ